MGINLAVVLGFFFVSGIVLTLILTFGRLIRPHNPTPIKNTTYECGEVPIGAGWFNFNNRFYSIALIFLIFDVEVALTVPIVLVFRSYVEMDTGLLVFFELFLFLAILFAGLIYLWIKGDFTWDRTLKNTGSGSQEVSK